MKCEKVNDAGLANSINEPLAIMTGHSLNSLIVSEDGKNAILYNIFSTVRKLPKVNADGKFDELIDEPVNIGISTTYNIETEEDKEYVDNAEINVLNMDSETFKKANSDFSSIYPLDLYHSNIYPVKFLDMDTDSPKVIFSGYHIIGDIDDSSTYYTKQFIIPFGTYIMLAKIKYDLIHHIETNRYKYYAYSGTDFKYIIKNLTDFKYIGSELVKTEDNGDTKVFSMYELSGDETKYIAMLFTTSKKVSIHKEKVLLEFAKEHHNKVFSFNMNSFLYYETDEGKKVAAFIVYDTEEKTYTIYNLTDKIAEELLNPDKEVE